MQKDWLNSLHCYICNEEVKTSYKVHALKAPLCDKHIQDIKTGCIAILKDDTDHKVCDFMMVSEDFIREFFENIPENAETGEIYSKIIHVSADNFDYLKLKVQ